jgi:hypothetical protein
MDTDTGKIYKDMESAFADMRAKGIPEKEAKKRLIYGTMPTLRKLRKMIRKQMRRETKR